MVEKQRHYSQRWLHCKHRDVDTDIIGPVRHFLRNTEEGRCTGNLYPFYTVYLWVHVNMYCTELWTVMAMPSDECQLPQLIKGSLMVSMPVCISLFTAAQRVVDKCLQTSRHLSSFKHCYWPKQLQEGFSAALHTSLWPPSNHLPTRRRMHISLTDDYQNHSIQNKRLKVRFWLCLY